MTCILSSCAELLPPQLLHLSLPFFLRFFSVNPAFPTCTSLTLLTSLPLPLFLLWGGTWTGGTLPSSIPSLLPPSLPPIRGETCCLSGICVSSVLLPFSNGMREEETRQGEDKTRQTMCDRHETGSGVVMEWEGTGTGTDVWPCWHGFFFLPHCPLLPATTSHRPVLGSYLRQGTDRDDLGAAVLCDLCSSGWADRDRWDLCLRYLPPVPCMLTGFCTSLCSL